MERRLLYKELEPIFALLSSVRYAVSMIIPIIQLRMIVVKTMFTSKCVKSCGKM